MFCFQCGCALTESNHCPNCGVNVGPYKKIIYTSNRLYNDGLEKARVRDLSGAIVSLKESLWCNKYNTDARNLLGLVYYEMGEMVAALSEWVISQHLQPGDNKADFLLEQVKTTAQITNINQIITRYNTALEAAQGGNFDVAQIQLRRVLQMNPHYVRAHQLLALLHIQDGQWKRALKVLQRCQTLDQNNTTTLRYLKEVQRQLSADSELQGGLRRAEQRSVISYQDGNETIIQPADVSGPRVGESRFSAGIVNLLIGLLVGAAVVGFLILPARIQSVRQQGQDEVRAVSEQLDTRNVQIRDLNAQINSLNQDAERLEAKLAEYESTSDTLSASDALFTAVDRYLKNPEDLESFEEAFGVIDREEIGTASDAFQSLYRSLYVELRPQLRAHYLSAGKEAYESQHPDYTAAIEALSKALEYTDEETDEDLSLVNYELADSYYRRYLSLPDTDRAAHAQDLEMAEALLDWILENAPEGGYAEDTASLRSQIAALHGGN